MARNEDRFDPIGESANSLQMPTINAAGASNRNTDGVYRNWIIRRQLNEKFRGMRVGQKILGMNFQPARARARSHHLR